MSIRMGVLWEFFLKLKLFSPLRFKQEEILFGKVSIDTGKLSALPVAPSDFKQFNPGHPPTGDFVTLASPTQALFELIFTGILSLLYP